MGEDEPSEGSGEEFDSQGGECSQDTGELAAAEELGREDECGGQAVEGEILPLDDGADRTGYHCSASLSFGVEPDSIALVFRCCLVVSQRFIRCHGVFL